MSNVTIIGGGAAVAKPFGVTQKVQINGTVFSDGNANGIEDSDEGGRAGFTVWLDTNLNGLQDSNEPAVSSDVLGNFRFDRLDAGTYLVRIGSKKGFKRTTAAGQSVTLASGQVVSGVLFGEKRVA